MRLKTCLITGSTSGIGRETALGLAGREAEILVHGRDRERGGEVLDGVEKKGGRALDLLLADFSRLEEVRRLARKVEENYERLNVLINNAGTYFPDRRLNEDGIEMTFLVNYLAPFLLTNLLLDLLESNIPARIVNVSSTMHSQTSFDFDKIKGEGAAKGFEAYRLSKLAVILFTYELAERLEGTDVTANCLHPGGIRSRLMREDKVKNLYWKYSPLLDSPKKGGETPIYLATSGDVGGVSGKYFVDKEIARSSPETYDRGLQKKVWKVSAELTGLGD